MANNVITIDDKEYNVDEFSDQAKYFLHHIQDVEAQAKETKQKLEQLEVTQLGFVKLLKEELEKDLT